MKKILVLLALAASASAMASTRTAVPSAMSSHIAVAEETKTRACAVLLKKMASSPEADTWRNRMRVWSCQPQARLDISRFREARR